MFNPLLEPCTINELVAAFETDELKLLDWRQLAEGANIPLERLVQNSNQTNMLKTLMIDWKNNSPGSTLYLDTVINVVEGICQRKLLAGQQGCIFIYPS